jgi:SAM-dependent methyltransferase
MIASMADVPSVIEHYAAGGPLARVTSALERLAPGGRRVTLEELGGFDEFHSAGRRATEHMADLFAPAAGDTVLDAGAGLGGPARYLAARFGCRVVGVDLSPDLAAVAALLNQRTGLADRVEVRLGDVADLELPDASVDHVWTQHAAMNIADRPRLYAGLRRVMRRGGRLAVYDVVAGPRGGELALPVPWASRPEHSHLVTADGLRALLEGAGFEIAVWEDPTAAMLERLLARPAATAEPLPLLGRHLFMDEPATKSANYLRNLATGRIALCLAIAAAT